MARTLDDAPDRMIDLGHTQLPYWRIGQGPDLVFVHGWPLHSATWRNIVPALAADFTCHLIDLPGAGQSRWTRATPRGIAGLADVLAEAIEHLELSGRFGFVAHDSGGSFARDVAARMPERISGLVLGNTEIPGHHPWRLKAMLAIARTPLRVLFPLGLRFRLGRWLLLRDCVVDTRLIERELVPRFIAPLNRSRRRLMGAMSMTNALKASDFDVVGEFHPRIEAPVKLVWGARDPWFKIAAVQGMVSSFGGPCALVPIEAAKLFPHEEHPERFAAEVRSHAWAWGAAQVAHAG